MGEALARLVNELSALVAPVVIVPDDYHVIKGGAVMISLSFCCSVSPPSVQVVLSKPTCRCRWAG